MDQTTTDAFRLPDINRVGMDAPMRWLSGGWRDFRQAAGPCTVYGIVLAGISAALAIGLLVTGNFTWIGVLAGGFLLVAPMLAMGLYEAARRLEQGERPTLSQMMFVRTNSTRDLAFLGMGLLFIYLFWGRMAQLIYALSTYQVHTSTPEFLSFMFTTEAGWTMAGIGTLVGGVIAILTFALVVVSPPMLLERRTDIFIATVTSVRAFSQNMGPMLLWAGLIALLTVIGIATGFLGLVIVFPVIGLATWRAYREVVAS